MTFLTDRILSLLEKKKINKFLPSMDLTLVLVHFHQCIVVPVNKFFKGYSSAFSAVILLHVLLLMPIYI